MIHVTFKSGTAAQVAAYLGIAGSLALDTDNMLLYIHDGVTVGGFPVLNNAPLQDIQTQLDALGIAEIDGLTAALALLVGVDQLGAAGGVAQLDAAGVIPLEQLPSFVNDVIEVADFASLPVTGESGKLYVSLDTNQIHRWSGSAYFEVAAKVASTDELGEGELNLFFTDARVRESISVAGDLSYDALTGVVSYVATVYTKADLGLGLVENYAPATMEEAQIATTNEAYMTPERVRDFVMTAGFVDNTGTWGLDEGAMGFSGEMTMVSADSTSYEGTAPEPETILFYGTTAENDALTLEAGQMSVDTETDTVRIHDGQTQGGFVLEEPAA